MSPKEAIEAITDALKAWGYLGCLHGEVNDVRRGLGLFPIDKDGDEVDFPVCQDGYRGCLCPECREHERLGLPRHMHHCLGCGKGPYSLAKRVKGFLCVDCRAKEAAD